MKSRFLFKYESGVPVPASLPRQRGGMPLYPDPKLYPEEIIAGYDRWPILYKERGTLLPGWIKPSMVEQEHESLKVGDSRKDVLSLIGLASCTTGTNDERFIFEDYSEQVSLIYEYPGMVLHCINIRESETSEFDPWDFVFVVTK